MTSKEDTEVLISALKDIFKVLDTQEGHFGDMAHSMWYFNTLMVCLLIIGCLNLVLDLVQLGVKLCEKP